MSTTVDLNADLGESFGQWALGDDEAMLAVVTSANVACGFHAGDPTTLRRTCELATARGIRIGAQVSYPDLVGFGRRFIDMAADDLTAAVIYQIGALQGLARAAGGDVSYVKPHGALYNRIVDDEVQAAAVAAAVVAIDPTLPLLGPAGSASARAASAAGLRVVTEAFADRAYLPDGSLVSRREPGAVLTDTSIIVERVLRMVRDHTVVAVDGSAVPVDPESICLHGDTPSAVAHAHAVRTALADADVQVAAFVGDRAGRQ
ncbi:LamB/YcsF family protein [Williamsia sterculiae]|uniref:5-oxoprolinase subunit A n=1 Tax=Williamsia sterculiae TaxID=1344003 RepID=A0A1N7CUD8_9NOCA|nr:5-oxoprolinase subunit PxpA [Williamsia sterculiae]SIR67074.1 UPF0271 protein [Williamsia sterculiae]